MKKNYSLNATEMKYVLKELDKIFTLYRKDNDKIKMNEAILKIPLYFCGDIKKMRMINADLKSMIRKYQQ